MARAKAKGAAKAIGPAAPRRSWFWLQGVVCGGAAAILPGTAVMLGVLLAPGLAMYAIEQGRGRHVARAMMMMGAASAFMPLRLLWEQGGSFETAISLLSDPARPLLSWGASGAGWLVAQVAELVTRFVLDAQAAQVLRKLNQEQEALNVEWFDGVKRPS